MTVSEAQADLRRAYANAGPGQVVVGIIWVVAGLIYLRSSLETAFAALFFGSFLIYPLTALTVRVILRRPAEAKGNPMIPVVPEGLPIMIALFFAAWLILPFRPEVVIPLSAIATGTHYIPFQTAYGVRAFWFFGAVLTMVGFGAIFGPVPSGAPLLFGVGALVAAFGLFLWMTEARR